MNPNHPSRRQWLASLVAVLGAVLLPRASNGTAAPTTNRPATEFTDVTGSIVTYSYDLQGRLIKTVQEG